VKEGQHIDDIFKDQLKDYELEAPMHLWEAVADASSSANDDKKRRKYPFWWLALLPVLLGLALLLWWPYANKPAEEQQLSNFPVALPDTEKEEVPTPITSPQASAAADTDSSLPVAEARSVEKSTSAGVPPSGKGLQKSFTPPLEAAKELVANSPRQEENLNQVESNGGLSRERIAETDKVSPTANSFRLDLLNAKAAALKGTPRADSLTFSLPKERSWRTTIDIMASMDFALRNLEAKDPAFAAYAKRRDDTETFRHGTSFGMRLSTVSDNGFAVRSGLNYSTINEQLNLKIGEEERLIAQIKYAEDGSIVGTDTTLALVGTYRIVNNRYTELDIPLLVGYEYRGQKVSLSFNSGILINMLSAQRGEFLSPNTDEAVSFSSSDPTSYRAFRNRLGIGFYGSMGVYFQINDNLQFLLEPYVKWRPGSNTVDGYILDQHYTTTGLFVGIRKEIY